MTQIPGAILWKIRKGYPIGSYFEVVAVDQNLGYLLAWADVKIWVK